MTKLIFLGTAGGRYATIFQRRATGGILIESGLENGKENSYRWGEDLLLTSRKKDGTTVIHIDPGPGSIVAMNKLGLDPTATDAILVSHCHPDHYTDAEILIEAMTKGSKSKEGVILASKSVLEGDADFGPAISKYHKSLVSKVITALPNNETKIGVFNITPKPVSHSDPTSVGFMISTPHGTIAYISDTSFSDEIAKNYQGSRVLILPVTRPRNARIKFHLSTEDAVKFVEQTKPELAILTHFGIRILEEGVDKEAAFVESETHTRSIAASDNMTIILTKEIKILK